METDQTIGMERYWQVVKRRWLPGGAAFLSIFLLGAIVSTFKSPIYEAQAKLRLKKNNVSSTLTELSKEIGSLAPLVDKGNPLNTEAEVIRSHPLIQKTIVELQLKDKQGELLSIDDFLTKFTVGEIANTDVIKVAYRDKNPQLAAKVVNTIVANYLDNNIMVNRAEAISAREFIEEQLPKAQKNLRQAEASIRQIKENNQIVSPKEEANTITTSLREIQRQITDTRSQIAKTTSQTEYIKNKLGFSTQEALTATNIGQSPEIQATIAKLQEVESELAFEKTRFTDTNPIVISLQEKRDSLQNLLNQQTKSLGGSQILEVEQDSKFGETKQQLASELIKLESINDGLTKQIAYLTAAERTQKAKAQELPQLEQKLQELERHLKASRSTYELLLEQMQVIKLAENQNIGNVRVIADALVPREPVSSRSVSYLASGLLAFLGAGSIIYLLEITDKSIKTIEEAKQIFGYNRLGIIPDTEQLKLMSLPEAGSDSLVPKILARDYASLPINESYRMLQSNLKFLSSDKQLKSIVVTSSVAGEGKSSVAANLAAAMAKTGHRVLLIDADLHHPMQHRIWKTFNDEGLSNVIAEQLEPEKVIEEVMPNLELLTSGIIPPAPATLLDSQRLKMLIDHWSENYDFVIIDTPAIDLAADAPIIGMMADGILLAVKPGKVEREQANFTKEILEQSGQNVLGMVFNGISPQSEPRTYYYHLLEDKQESLKTIKMLDSAKQKSITQGDRI